LEAGGGTGVSAAVLIADTVRVAGVSGISHGSVVITPQTLFSASSITKIYVAALALRLVEDGLLTLSDSLHQWIDNYQHIDSNITVRQLLNHTSGVYDFISHPTAWDTIIYDPSRVWEPEEIVSRFVGEPYSTPGSELHYSNTGYLLAGMVIEAVTGSSVSSQLRTRFWEPLGLTSTFFEVEETVVGTVAHAWINTGGESLIDFSSVPRTAAYSAVWTAGAVFTTAEELAEWGRALYGGGVLSEASVAEMLYDPGTGVGLGTDLLLGPEFAEGETVVGFVGSGLGYSGVLAYLLDYDISVAILMNDNNLDCLFGITSALLAAVLEHLS
jgi:D-alanyl-D-alanine carboxypeptidase